MAVAYFQQRRRYIFTVRRQADDALRQSALIANDTWGFSHCFSLFELQLRGIGKNMLYQIVAIMRWNVTGSVKEKNDCYENLLFAWTRAHSNGKGRWAMW
ncbi:hypothetical protein GOODEAATRI_024042 [Goodea atripinnis]|uniref:Uncharacterized protein n=1 Tax=Goodea atripinnis TaxID=208336 RepID=A0ABV0NPD5_9TELE